MDSVHRKWNGSKGDQISTRSKPMSDTLSKLAQLITCMEYKPKPQTSSSIRKDCGHEFSELNLVQIQEKETLQKLHCCQHCGQRFALLSSLQLHKCLGSSSMCQTCRGKPTRSSSCPSCGSEPSGPHRPEDPISQNSSPYACAPCGQAFSHKQELLHHQQAGGCQPVKTLKPPSPPSSPSAGASLSACTVCSRTFRTSAGLSCHMRFSPAHTKRSTKTMFSCRTCDKSFPKASLLLQHRKEEHRREIKKKALRKENSEKAPRRRRKGEPYPCLRCGKVFLHHLTRYAHFKHCGSPHADAAGRDPKGAKDLRPSQENRPRRGRPRTKNLPALTETKQKEEVERNERDEDEDGEYPCTSCDQVFSSKAALHAHEEVHEEVPEGVHQPADPCWCCSVCAGGIPLSQVPEDCEKKVYHCVPCAEAFIALDTFLEHCQKHLIRENQDEFSDD
ncbi:zinc finger protein [Pimephales promelas]|nr:zinc finger protein [Pimephales promelas]